MAPMPWKKMPRRGFAEIIWECAGKENKSRKNQGFTRKKDRIRIPQQMSAPLPVLNFWRNPSAVVDLNETPVIPISHHGRSGWRTSSLEEKAGIPVPQLNAPQGSLTWWILPREDFSTSVATPWMLQREPAHQIIVLLGDTHGEAAEKDHRVHKFALIYVRDWYQQLQTKWHHGEVYGESDDAMLRTDKEKAFIGLGHLNLQRGHWVQLGLSWDEPANDYRMYLNGVLVQTSLVISKNPLRREQNSGFLYAGHPQIASGELAVYERSLSAGEFAQIYQTAAPVENKDLDLSIARTHGGKNLPALDWTPPGGWSEQVNLPLNRADDLARFYVQGMKEAPSITPEGLRVRTSVIHISAIPKPENWASEEPHDPTQVYLWLEDFFTGDFAIEYEFKPLQRHGLSLLMTRAAGLQGEDFLKSQPRRISGAMRMVCWENVRNYHWEYYRQMGDARSDTDSHVLVKNPYLHPLAYQAAAERSAVGKWHRLQFVHEGRRLRGAIDGTVVIDVEDDPFAGFGPVMRTGTFAIRCMWYSDIVFRNLRVWTKPDLF